MARLKIYTFQGRYRKVIKKDSYILFFLGLMGFLLFLVGRSYVDYYGGAPILESRSQVEQKIERIAQSLSFSTDTMAVYSIQEQHKSYFENLQSESSTDLRPIDLNEEGLHLQSWLTVLGAKESVDQIRLSAKDLFDEYGQLLVRVANNGNVIRLRSNPKRPNPTFVKAGDPLKLAESIIEEILGYDLSAYELQSDDDDDDSDELVQIEGRTNEGTVDEQNFSELLNFKWKKVSSDNAQPTFLNLALNSVVREYTNGTNFSTEFGYQIDSFIAKHDREPTEFFATGQGLDLFTIIFFISLIVLAVFAFIIGVKNIFKGKVEWKRALIIFSAISLGLYGWQALFYLSSFSPFFDDGMVLITAINNLIFGIILGMYMALAYVGWEALARSQNHAQLDVVDALWQRKFFVRETGLGLIQGFAVGAILIGLFVGALWVLDLYFIQVDSQFGFTESSSKFAMLTLNMSAWTTTWLVIIVQVGFVYGIINHWFSNAKLAFGLSILVVALFTTTVGREIGTNGEFLEDYVIFLILSAVTLFSYKKYGILTTCTAWWVFICTFMITPYINSESIEVAYKLYAQLGIMGMFLVYGFIAYKKGTPLEKLGSYVPEYEEKIAQHLRVEREMEIARESQYKLMPIHPPKGPGFDVYGFFLPSFEVGGDYFDYVLTEKDGEAVALTMAVVDVSGKAMRAAMPAIFTSGLLLSRMKEDCPAKILSQVAEPIYNRTDRRTFITCAMARYDLKTKELSIANAGHCKPVLKRNGKASFIDTIDPRYPLGLRAEVDYQPKVISLNKGDFFLLYSDGLPEAVNEEGERFGFESVPELLERIDTDNLSANEIALEIKRTVQKFSNYQLADDTTVICLKV